MIKTIFFDIGGVLLNIYPERTVEYLSTLTKLSEDQILASFPEEEHHKYERGEISDNEFYLAVKNSLPINNGLTSNNFWTAWSMMVGDKTKVADLMDELTEHYSVWLLSNTNPYHIIEEKRLDLFSKINGAIYSFEVGTRKPEEEIFNKALDIVGVKAEEALFIDDLSENVVAAQQVKLNAIRFVSHTDLWQRLVDLDIM